MNIALPLLIVLYAVLLVGRITTPVAAEGQGDRDYLDACVAAAGGPSAAARSTCFGQVSEVCLASSEQTTADMQSCADRERAVWNVLLDEAYTRLRASEPPDRAVLIRDAQQVWLVWREARCGVYETFEGSIYRPLASLCRAETTAQRVSDLWELEAGVIGKR